jgi:tetratricopeptide (TPR) repeat protein
MGALVDRLVHADKGTAHRALTAAYQLPQPKACWEPNAARADALPDDPARRARVLALQKQIAVAAALRSTGGCKGVVEATDRGLDEARAIPHRESEAVLLSIRAGCERQAGDVERAIASREESFAAAVAAGDDEQAAVVAAKIAFDLSSGLGKVREAERWLAIGHGALEREGQDDRAQAELLNSEVEIVSGEGYPERAIPLHERAIALLTAVYGPDHPAVAAAINNYATDLSSVGRLEESIAQLRKSAAIDESVFGPDDPMLHYDYNNIGVGYTLLGHYDDARVAIERSLALVASLGPMNANAVVPWASLAVLDNRDGRPDAALGDVDHAMQIVKATGDNGARFLPCLYEERGTALLVKGDAAGAIDACSRALKLQEEQGVIAADKLYTDDALTCLGQAELAAGRVHDAVGHLERGATLKKRDWKAALPIAEIALAKALRAEGKDLERAQKLADDGLAGLRGLDGVERQVRDAEGWGAAGGRK